MRTNAYIDGFNFDYGCYKHDTANQPQKWLDLRALCAAILPGHEIHREHYFTARASNALWNPGATLRQETYIRALRACLLLYIHLGNFQPNARTGITVAAQSGAPRTK